VFEAIVTVREATDHSELTKSTLRILFLDFKDFDKISHEYLFTMLNRYEFSKRFQQRIKNMYENAT